MKKLTALLPFVVALGCRAPAFAALTCTGAGSFFFSETGSTGGVPQDASACVTIISATQIKIVIENDVPIIVNNPSELDGFAFTLSGTSPVVTGIASVTAQAPILCAIPNQPCIVDPLGYVDQTTTTVAAS